MAQEERDAEVRELVVDVGNGLQIDNPFRKRERELSQFVAGRGNFSRQGGARLRTCKTARPVAMRSLPE